MPPTRQAAAVTDVYRRRMIALREDAARDTMRRLEDLDFDVPPAALARQLEQWRRRSTALAASGAGRAGELSVAYLSAYLVAAGGDPLSVPIEPVQPPPADFAVARGALLWRLGRGVGRELALKTATATARRIARDTVGAGATRTLTEGIRGEPQIDGWRRTTSSSCCSRCARLTGVKYSDVDDFDQAHRACRCSPEPTVLGRAEVFRRQSPTVVTP